MAVKLVNEYVRTDVLMPILLVFGALSLSLISL